MTVTTDFDDKAYRAFFKMAVNSELKFSSYTEYKIILEQPKIIP